MGLFGKSKKQKTVEEIGDCVGKLNQHWRQLSRSLYSNGDITDETERIFREGYGMLASISQRLNTLLSTLSEEDRMRLAVPGVTGGYIPFAFWFAHYDNFLSSLEKKCRR